MAEKTLELILRARSNVAQSMNSDAKAAVALAMNLDKVNERLQRVERKRLRTIDRASDVFTAERLASLRQEARLGDHIADARAKALAINQQFEARRRALLAIARNEMVTEDQRVRAATQLNFLEQQRQRTIQHTARTMAQQVMLQRQQAQAAAAAQRFAVGARFAGAAAAGLGGSYGTMAVGGAIAGRALGLSGGAIAGLGAAYLGGAAIRQMTRQTAEFEFAMSRVRALTGATGAEFDKLQAKALELGQKTIYTASQAAEAMSIFARAGFKTNQILSATKPALDLAAAGQIDLAEATEITARIMAAMGLSAEQMTEAVDVLVKAFVTAQTDLSGLGAAMKFVGPIAKTTGQSFQTTVAAVQALSNAGLGGELAGTSLRQVLIKLADTTGDAQKQLDRLGIKVLDVRGNMLPLPDIVGQFNRALEGLGSGEKLAILSQIFEARAAAGFAVLLDNGGKKLQQMTNDLTDTGVAARITAEQLDNLKGKVIQLQSAWSTVAIEKGGFLTPVLGALTDFGTNVARWLQGGWTVNTIQIQREVDPFDSLNQQHKLMTEAAGEHTQKIAALAEEYIRMGAVAGDDFERARQMAEQYLNTLERITGVHRDYIKQAGSNSELQQQVAKWLNPEPNELQQRQDALAALKSQYDDLGRIIEDTPTWQRPDEVERLHEAYRAMGIAVDGQVDVRKEEQRVLDEIAAKEKEISDLENKRSSTDDAKERKAITEEIARKEAQLAQLRDNSYAQYHDAIVARRRLVEQIAGLEKQIADLRAEDRQKQAEADRKRLAEAQQRARGNQAGKILLLEGAARRDPEAAADLAARRVFDKFTEAIEAVSDPAIRQALREALIPAQRQARQEARQPFIDAAARRGDALRDAQRTLLESRARMGDIAAERQLEIERIRDRFARDIQQLEAVMADELATREEKLKAAKALAELEQQQAAEIARAETGRLQQRVIDPVSARTLVFGSPIGGGNDPQAMTARNTAQAIREQQTTNRKMELLIELVRDRGGKSKTYDFVFVN